MKLVLIEWLDSFGCSSEWQKLEVDKPKPLLCQSVGWLLHDGDDCKVIVPHVTKDQDRNIDPQGCGDMTIPTKSVMSIFELNLLKNNFISN